MVAKSIRALLHPVPAPAVRVAAAPAAAARPAPSQVVQPAQARAALGADGEAASRRAGVRQVDRRPRVVVQVLAGLSALPLPLLLLLLAILAVMCGCGSLLLLSRRAGCAAAAAAGDGGFGRGCAKGVFQSYVDRPVAGREVVVVHVVGGAHGDGLGGKEEGGARSNRSGGMEANSGR